MSDFDYDLFVIGAGSGGVRAARMSASYGARVAIAEESHLGGTCVNVGCVPKKLFSYASHVHEDLEIARSFGWQVEGAHFDWPTLRENKNREIERLNGIYGRLLDQAGVTLYDGRATLIDRHTVEVEGERIRARYVLIAVGGRPFVPEIPGCELGFTSDEAFYLDELPRRVLVVGGGYIGVEFAGIFHGLGLETTLSYRRELFLRGFDHDLRATLADEMRAKGIEILFETDLCDMRRTDEGIECGFATSEPMASRVFDGVMFATGRLANTAGLGLEAVGVEMDALGNIPVDAYSRTNIDNIFAIGDVTNRINLTPVAIHEGMCLASTLFDGEVTAPDHENVASAVFSHPEIATVGLTEEEAAERGDVVTFQSRFRPMKLTLGDLRERTLMKLVVDAESDRVLGVHVLGRDAAEIVQGAAIAVKMGATKADFDRTMGIHPTAGEELVTMREGLPSAFLRPRYS